MSDRRRTSRYLKGKQTDKEFSRHLWDNLVQIASNSSQNNILLSDLQSELASIYSVITYTVIPGNFIANFTIIEFETELIIAYN